MPCAGFHFLSVAWVIVNDLLHHCIIEDWAWAYLHKIDNLKESKREMRKSVRRYLFFNEEILFFLLHKLLFAVHLQKCNANKMHSTSFTLISSVLH